MDRSRHSRALRTLCTVRHRCRQTPQRRSRRPNRSMWTIMYRSVSSTFVTVCAFNPSCFLRNVSISTSISSSLGPSTTALKELDGSGIQAAHSAGNLLHLKPFNFNCTFGIRTIFSVTLHHRYVYTPEQKLWLDSFDR